MNEFAKFCANIGTVIDFNRERAEINIGSSIYLNVGTNEYPYNIVLAYNLPSSRDMWSCSNVCSMYPIPVVTVQGVCYETAYTQFINTFIAKAKQLLLEFDRIMSTMPTATEDTFEAITSIGEVCTYNNRSFVVSIRLLTETIYFKRLRKSDGYKYEYEFCGTLIPSNHEPITVYREALNVVRYILTSLCAKYDLHTEKSI